MAAHSRLGAYYTLAKPGIIYGNSIATIAGFFFASSLSDSFHLTSFLATIIGTALVIGSSCVVNNCLDRNIDSRMMRTQRRSLVSGEISLTHAIIYATILGLVGLATLLLFVNLLTALTGIFGYFFYVVVYGYAKRHTPFSTLIGSIPGAVPPLAGYVAVTNVIDSAAIILFLILTVWQMPHFYAIAMRRKEEYATANLPVLPVVKGDKITKQHIFGYLIAYVCVAPLLTFTGYMGYTYLVVSLIIAVYWLVVALRAWSLPPTHWAKKVFFASLFVLLAQCCIISVGALLP